MNDQTSPTAGGQGPGSSQWRNPFQEPQGAQGLPGVPQFGDGRPRRPTVRSLLRDWRADLLAAGLLLVAGTVLGLLAGLAWYRFAPTVLLSLPAEAVSQVKANVDQSALLVAPEAKGIASVDGYYFMFTAAVGLLLGVFGFWLGRRGLLAGRDVRGERTGAGVGAWAGVLFGGLAASTLAAALGRWVSLPDPLTVLRTIAAGHSFHAPVALHARGLYFAAPLLGTVMFLALTAAFTKPAPPPWQPRAQIFFSSENPYGFPADGADHANSADNGNSGDSGNGKPGSGTDKPGPGAEGTTPENPPGNTPHQAGPPRS